MGAFSSTHTFFVLKAKQYTPTNCKIAFFWESFQPTAQYVTSTYIAIILFISIYLRRQMEYLDNPKYFWSFVIVFWVACPLMGIICVVSDYSIPTPTSGCYMTNIASVVISRVAFPVLNILVQVDIAHVFVTHVFKPLKDSIVFSLC